MLNFKDISDYKPGIIFSLLSKSFAELLGDGLEEKIERFDREVFENPDTVGACVFISTFNGEVVGMASWDPSRRPEFGVIGFNGILPKYQGKGFGKAQIKEVLRRLKESGFQKAFVRTGEHPFFTRAQKMYVDCGFKESKRYPTGDQPSYGTIDYEMEL